METPGNAIGSKLLNAVDEGTVREGNKGALIEKDVELRGHADGYVKTAVLSKVEESQQ